MKDLYTKKLSGPPLPHDEWVKRQQELEAEVLNPKATKAATIPDDSEPIIAGKLLSFYDGMSDDELDEIDGVGPATIKQIHDARAKRDAK